MTEEQTIAHLTRIAGGMLFMTPKQLATVIPCSEKQQSVLRKLKKFPIRTRDQMGDRVYYSVKDVADYILYNKVTADVKQSAPTQVVAPPEPEPAPRKKRGRKPVEVDDLSHIFIQRSFVHKLQKEAQELQAYADQMTKFHKSFALKEKLSDELLTDDDEEFIKRQI